MQSFQEIIFKLKQYWAERGCIIQEPYDAEVGAGTMCPETFLRVLGPNPTASPTCSPAAARPTAATATTPTASTSTRSFRSSSNPSPDDVIEQYLGSLEAIGIDLRKHDIKFEEDNWEAPTLGRLGHRLAGHAGWPRDLAVHLLPAVRRHRPGPGPGRTHLRPGTPDRLPAGEGQRLRYRVGAAASRYGDVRYKDELQYSVYNFEMADIATLWKLFDLHEGEATRLIELYDPKSAGEEAVPPAARLRPGAEVLQPL